MVLVYKVLELYLFVLGFEYLLIFIEWWIRKIVLVEEEFIFFEFMREFSNELFVFSCFYKCCGWMDYYFGWLVRD